MNDILSELSKPSWWVTVVIVGLLINLFSAYIKNPIDKVLSKFSSKWRESLQQAKLRREKDLENLQDINVLINAKLDMLYAFSVVGVTFILGLVSILLMNDVMATTTYIYSMFSLAEVAIPASLIQIATIVAQATLSIGLLLLLSPKILKGLRLEILLRDFERKKGNKNNPYGLF